MTNDDERYLRQIGYGDICDRVRQYERDIRRIDDEKIAVLREQIKGLQKRVEAVTKERDDYKATLDSIKDFVDVEIRLIRESQSASTWERITGLTELP